MLAGCTLLSCFGFSADIHTLTRKSAHQSSRLTSNSVDLVLAEHGIARLPSEQSVGSVLTSTQEARDSTFPDSNAPISRLSFLEAFLEIRASFLIRTSKEIPMKLTSDTMEQKMKSVKDSCHSAPFGEKRAAAMKHFYRAETAYRAQDTIKTKYELEAAQNALE